MGRLSGRSPTGNLLICDLQNAVVLNVDPVTGTSSVFMDPKLQIIQIPVNGDGSAGTPSVFITGINSPDGIMVDLDDNIWICANQEDEIVVVDKTGKVIAKLGDFAGIDPKGIARGLLYPASLAFSPDGKWLYVSNLTLFQPFLAPLLPGNPQLLAIDSAWTLQVQGYTVSVLPAKIPPIAGD
jgi:sugar lactone lactonase YvrE